MTGLSQLMSKNSVCRSCLRVWSWPQSVLALPRLSDTDGRWPPCNSPGQFSCPVRKIFKHDIMWCYKLCGFWTRSRKRIFKNQVIGQGNGSMDPILTTQAEGPGLRFPAPTFEKARPRVEKLQSQDRQGRLREIPETYQPESTAKMTSPSQWDSSLQNEQMNEYLY